MPNPYVNKASPYQSGAKTGHQIAAERYGKSKAPDIRTGPLIADAESPDWPQDNYAGSRARQISESGKVRK